MNRTLQLLTALAALAFLAQCETPAPARKQAAGSGKMAAAFDTVYRVLQHPRCMNCHPAGETPLVGDDSRPHPQNVQRGELGLGLFAMRCTTCHQPQNAEGAHLPPGAPHWQLPTRVMPLVFQGKSAKQLAAQLRDPKQNGGKTPAQLLEHVEKDPLVLWGWAPGEGRAPVPVPHEEFVRAMRTWVEGGCAVPK